MSFISIMRLLARSWRYVPGFLIRSRSPGLSPTVAGDPWWSLVGGNRDRRNAPKPSWGPFRLAVPHLVCARARFNTLLIARLADLPHPGSQTKLRLHHPASCSNRECRQRRITIFVYTVNRCADVRHQVLENQAPGFHCHPERRHGAPHSEDTSPAHNHFV